MAKELPYFRFTVQEWQNGDIGIESYELKGLFIDICGFYWIKDCTTTLAMLQKRFSNATSLLEQLISLGILKVDEEQNVNINFLDDQFDLLSEKRKKRQLAGRKGGLSKSSNAKAMLKQNSIYKDKDKENDKDNITTNGKEKIQDEIFIAVTKNQRWLETMAMNHKSSIELVINHLRDFYWHCIAYDYWKSTESKVMQHFNNWIKKGNPIPERKKRITFDGF